MVDPAIDHPGRRLDQFLTNAIAELKAKDSAVEEPQTTEPAKGSPEEVAAWNAAREKLPTAPVAAKPKVSAVDPFKLLADKMAAGTKAHTERARSLGERWGKLDERAETLLSKAETKQTQKEVSMDAFEASLEHLEEIGNEGN